MSFNSLEFLVFFFVFFIVYWFVLNDNFRSRNVFVLIASYIFYGWWDWRFLILILFSTIVDFKIGLELRSASSSQRRKKLLFISLITNIGLLAVFKYFNFFVENAYWFFDNLGLNFNRYSLDIIIPVGISFYTFQTLSYTIDVYRSRIEPTADFINFATFVSFFPQLVAGPIERASHLLPQFERRRKFDYNKACDGLRQILWGFFKKIVIADNCAVFVNMIFESYDASSGSTLLLGAILFSFQIYGDFSGYSDIAIGTSRLLGFDLKQNFAFPYFSRNIAEFWRRWHISLSSWFKDYLYIPLGGSRGGMTSKVRNTFIVFVVSGFWHGANWTFIFWGFVNALCFLPLLLSNSNRGFLNVVAENSVLPSVTEFIRVLSTFLLVSIIWIFFRSTNISQALSIIHEIFSSSLLSRPSYLTKKMLLNLTMICLLLIVEWSGRRNRHALEINAKSFTLIRPVRWSFYYILLFIILLYPNGKQEFIYFQF